MSPADTDPKPVALVLGLSGAIGGAVAHALARRGYAIRGLARDPGRARAALAARGGLAFEADWRSGDALDAAAVARAAAGARIVMHGANPPKYRRWREDAIPMLANAIAAARACRARLLFPGNVYVYAPQAGSMIDETAPKRPATVKGAVRAEMERMLEDAASRGVRSIVLRAGDYFGPGASNTWFAQMPVVKGGRIRAVRDLASPGIGHSWAYLPDLGEAFARLAERDAHLPDFAPFHFQGHWTDPGRAMADAVRRAAGLGEDRIAAFPWWAMRLISPAVPFVREALEMRWLWTHPLRLDNRRLEAAIGPEPHTPLADAVAATLATPQGETRHATGR